MGMDLSFIDELSESSDYLKEILPNLWLMDDHRWAFYVWERMRLKDPGPYTMVHLDYHYDGVNDFRDREDLRCLLSASTESEIYRLVKDDHLIRYDSFIAPAIIRGFIKEVHFYCLQSDGETDPGIDSDILHENGCDQFFHSDLKELVAAVGSRPILFDLCLDLFNKDDDKLYEGTLWSDSEIRDTLDICQPLLAAAAAITVSLSFGYSGTEEQTRHLARLVLPGCLAHMNSRTEV